MNIVSNYHHRPILSGPDLTKAEHDNYCPWCPWSLDEPGADCTSLFIRYRDQVICLSDVMRVEPDDELAAAGWHGFLGTSYFSGLAVRLSDDWETAQVAFVHW